VRRRQDDHDAAADSYDDPANSFWDRFGSRTVERLQLAPGARERVRDANMDYIRQPGIRAVEANVIYARATKS